MRGSHRFSVCPIMGYQADLLDTLILARFSGELPSTQPLMIRRHHIEGAFDVNARQAAIAGLRGGGAAPPSSFGPHRTGLSRLDQARRERSYDDTLGGSRGWRMNGRGISDPSGDDREGVSIDPESGYECLGIPRPASAWTALGSGHEPGAGTAEGTCPRGVVAGRSGSRMALMEGTQPWWYRCPRERAMHFGGPAASSAGHRLRDEGGRGSFRQGRQ
jgi:hypothetical protein